MELELDSPGLLEALLDSLVDYAIAMIDPAGHVRIWSRGAEALFGYSAGEMVGRSLDMLFTDEDVAAGVPAAELARALRGGRVLDLRDLSRRDGSRFWAECALTAVYSREGTLAGFVKVVRDATARKHEEERILRLARVDPLTGLANRAALDERLPQLLEAAARHRHAVVVLMIDLDQFKPVNDVHGHAIGDRLLRQVARRIASETRESDLLARLGGDEFVLVQGDVLDPGAGGRVAGRIIDAVARPFHIGGLELKIGASVGISVFPQDGGDAPTLLRRADMALYKVKAEARGGFHYFTPRLDDLAHRRGRDQALVRAAVRAHAFEVHYQPQVAGDDGHVVGVEALLRCTDPALAGRPVEEIITAAAASGLMRELGTTVLEQACAQLRQWRDAGVPPFVLCMNFCVAELSDPRMLEHVAEILQRTGLDYSDLEIEVTERELFDYASQGHALLEALRERGASVAIDDFGTGYSSLGQLSQLPVDRIKLDRSFVRRIDEDPHSRVVARAVVSLANALELDTVVEGVETAAQADFFRNGASVALQGYYYSQPLPAGAMLQWLQARAGGARSHA